MRDRLTTGRRWAGMLVAMLVAGVMSSCALLGFGAATTAFAAGAQTTAPWQVLGPGQGHTVVSLAVDPQQGQIVYAGDAQGNVYRDVLGATSGLIAGKGLEPNSTVPTLLTDPAHPNVIYAGTSSGLYASSDYSDSWKASGSGFPGDDTITALAFAPGGTTLIAGSAQHGVYTTASSGAHNWVAADAGLPAGVAVHALLTTTTPGTVYLASGGSGLYLSRDGGRSWSASASGLPSGAQVVSLAAVAGSAGASEVVFAGTSSGVYASRDAGTQWTASGSGLPTGQVNALYAAAASATIYAGVGHVVYASSDGGAQWTPVGAALTHDVTALVVAHDAKLGPVVFVAAGDLARLPGGAVVASHNGLATVIVLIVIALLLLFMWQRSRRNVVLLTAQMQPNQRTYGGQYVPLDGPPGADLEYPEQRTLPHMNGHQRLPEGRLIRQDDAHDAHDER